MKLFSYFIAITFLSISCSSGLTVYDLKPQSTPSYVYEPFRLFTQEDEISINEFSNVGSFEYKDAGLTLDCGYSTVTNLAIDKARSIGANGIKITEHKYPDAYSTCHRIKGVFIYSDDMWKYENEIIWHKKRKLQLRDFRDSTYNEGLVSTTMSGFKFEFKSIPIKGNVQLDVKTFFNPKESYINSTDTTILNLQQLHFDASELHSRVFINRILNECKNAGQLEAKYQIIYNEVNADLRNLQGDISNAYRNIEERDRLMKLVNEGLENYSDYSKDIYFMPI